MTAQKTKRRTVKKNLKMNWFLRNPTCSIGLQIPPKKKNYKKIRIIITKSEILEKKRMGGEAKTKCYRKETHEYPN
jgi:hypothetical protein